MSYGTTILLVLLWLTVFDQWNLEYNGLNNIPAADGLKSLRNAW